jgi:hypothetical protein
MEAACGIVAEVHGLVPLRADRFEYSQVEASLPDN